MKKIKKKKTKSRSKKRSKLQNSKLNKVKKNNYERFDVQEEEFLSVKDRLKNVISMDRNNI